MFARRSNRTHDVPVALALLATWVLPLALTLALAGHELTAHHHHGDAAPREHHHHDDATHADHEAVLELLVHGHEHDGDVPPHDHDAVVLEANGRQRSSGGSVANTPVAVASSSGSIDPPAIAKWTRAVAATARSSPPETHAILLL